MSLFSWFFFHSALRLYLVRFPNPLDIGSQAGTLSNYTQLLESTIPALSLSSLVPRSLLLLLYLSNRVKWISSKLLITWLWYFLFYFKFFTFFEIEFVWFLEKVQHNYEWGWGVGYTIWAPDSDHQLEVAPQRHTFDFYLIFSVTGWVGRCGGACWANLVIGQTRPSALSPRTTSY